MRTTRYDGITRRDALGVGAFTAFGLTLPAFLKTQAMASSRSAPPKAKRGILIWLDGGPSHLETFDPKPDAPTEVRGPFGCISTAVPGVQICELLPRTAKLLDQAAIIRSMTSPLGEHNFGAHYVMTGYKPTPVVEYPSYGSVVAHLRGGQGVLPSHVAVPNFRTGGGRYSGNGYLPESCRPFAVGGDPGKPNFSVRDLSFYREVTAARLERRREFLSALDGFHRSAESSAASGEPSELAPELEQAFRLVTSPDARQAFSLDEERPEVRNRYGRKTIGQSCLLARRLLERGVPFVTVNNTGWDTHNNLVTRLKDGYTGAKTPVGLIPSLDQAFSALLADLKSRGMLDDTLILVMGEFGRTPKLNTQAGRDHWPRVFSVLLAGGGVRGGQVIGSSDGVGEGPQDRPITPADLACTVYTLFGIDPALEMHTGDGRPVQINQGGEVISELL